MDDLERRLRAAVPPGIDLVVRRTEEAGGAVGIARNLVGEADLIVAAGGDGTVAEVATGTFGSGVPLGILPAGSTNITARELGIPTDPNRAIALLFGPHRLKTMDVGRCGDRCFLHMAGAGLDSRFFAATNRRLKRRVGWLAYLPPAALALRMPPAVVTVVADRLTMTAVSPLVVVANGGSIIAPRLRLDSTIRSDDGLLDVLVFTATGPAPIVRTLGRLATLRLADSPFVSRAQTRSVSITAEPPLPIQLDGDVVGGTPATFQIEPRSLRLIVPAPYAT
jgi:diacylglycerol kinase family enzyme